MNESEADPPVVAPSEVPPEVAHESEDPPVVAHGSDSPVVAHESEADPTVAHESEEDPLKPTLLFAACFATRRLCRSIRPLMAAASDGTTANSQSC